MHLTPDELVDLAEGTRRPSSVPHLATCDLCRRQVEQLRATLSLAASLNVPEPSPLFWDQFSVRVREAIAATPERSGWRWAWTRFRWPIAIAVAPAIIVLSVLTARVVAPALHLLPRPETMVFVAGAPPPSDMLSADDPAFSLLTDLSGSADAETVNDAELPSIGSAEHAVTHLTDEELRALQTLLKDELTNSGD